MILCFQIGINSERNVNRLLWSLNHLCTMTTVVCVIYFSHVWLFVTLWTVACQAPLSMGFSSHEYWNGMPFERWYRWTYLQGRNRDVRKEIIETIKRTWDFQVQNLTFFFKIWRHRTKEKYSDIRKVMLQKEFIHFIL